MRCILHSPGPKCRGGPGEEGKRYRAGRASVERNGLHFRKSSSPAVIPLSVPWGVATVTGGHMSWGCRLVKGPHCSCVKPPSVCPSARDRGFTPLTYTHTHTPALSLTDNTPNTHSYYRGAAVWLQLYKLHIYKDDTSFKRDKSRQTHSDTVEQKNAHTHTSLVCVFFLSPSSSSHP